MAATTIRGTGSTKVPEKMRAFVIDLKEGAYPPAAKVLKTYTAGQVIQPGEFAILLDADWEPFGTHGWVINKTKMDAGTSGQLKLVIGDPEQCNIRIQRQVHAGSSEDHHQNAWVHPNGTLIINQSTHVVKVNVHDTTSSDVDVDSRCP